VVSATFSINSTVAHRIERDQIDVVPLDQRRDDTLRRHLRDPGNGGNSLRQVGGQGLVRRLHGEQARGDVHEGRTRDDDKVGAHAREAGRHTLAQRPAGDEAGKPDAHAEHHGHAEKDRSQSTATDVLRGQPDQQPTITPASRHLAPRGQSKRYHEA